MLELLDVIRRKKTAQIDRQHRSDYGQFTTPAVEALNNAEAVTLFYDVHKQIVGLMPSGTGRSNAFLLKQKKEQLYWSVNARSFCLHFDIKIGRTILFNNVEIDET